MQAKFDDLAGLVVGTDTPADTSIGVNMIRRRRLGKELPLSRFEARLAKSPDDANLAESLADFKLGGLAQCLRASNARKRIDITKVTDSWAKLKQRLRQWSHLDLASRAFGRPLERVDGYEASNT